MDKYYQGKYRCRDGVAQVNLLKRSLVFALPVQRIGQAGPAGAQVSTRETSFLDTIFATLS